MLALVTALRQPCGFDCACAHESVRPAQPLQRGCEACVAQGRLHRSMHTRCPMLHAAAGCI